MITRLMVKKNYIKKIIKIKSLIIYKATPWLRKVSE